MNEPGSHFLSHYPAQGKVSGSNRDEGPLINLLQICICFGASLMNFKFFSKTFLNWLNLLKSDAPSHYQPPSPQHTTCSATLDSAACWGRSGPWTPGKSSKQSPEKFQDRLMTQYEAVFLPESAPARPHLKEAWLRAQPLPGCLWTHGSCTVSDERTPSADSLAPGVSWVDIWKEPLLLAQVLFI